MANRAAEKSRSDAKVHIFISYSRANLETADQIAAALEARDFSVTIDRRDLPYGEEWQKELAEFIRLSDTVVWLVSPDSVKSQWCRWELGEVRARNKRLIPIMIGAVPPAELPEAIGRIHVLPAEGTFHLDAHLDMLAAALNADRKWIKEHTRLADRARQWIERDRPSALLLRGSALKDAERWQNTKPAQAPQPSDDILELMLASRRAATRRQRVTTIASMAAAAFSLTLAFVTYTQWQRADRSYGAARGTVNSLIAELASGFQNAEGIPVTTINRSLDVVKQLIGDLQRSSGGDPQLESSRAAMFYQFSKTYQKTKSREEAIKNSNESLLIRRRLARGASAPDAMISDLIESLNLAADLEREQKKYADARAFLEEALIHATRLHEREPDNVSRVIALSRVLVRVGDLDVLDKDFQAAKTRYDFAFQKMQLAFRASADEPSGELKRELSWTYNKVGDVNAALKSYPAALSAYEKGLCIRRSMLAEAPGNTKLQEDIGWNYEKIARAQQAGGDLAGAAASLMEAFVVRRSLARDIDQRIWQRDLASTLHQIAEIKLREKQFASALAFFDAATDVWRRLARRLPSDKETADRLAASFAARKRATEERSESGESPIERLWKEVVAEEEQEHAAASLAKATADPGRCWAELLTELRGTQS